MKIGFIGLGNMGQPMARNLLRAGHQLKVYNRTASRAEELRSDGATVAPSPADTAVGAEVLITMLSDDQAVRECVLGSPESRGAIRTLPRGAAHISMSTISVDFSRELSEAHSEAGQQFISAPVFGRPDAAAASKLSIIAAGIRINRFNTLFQALGENLFVVGEDPPVANAVKLAGNFTIMSMIESLGEAYALVRRHGVSTRAFLDIVNGSLFKSPVYENYGTIIAEKRFEPAGFKLKLGLKDVRLVLKAADNASVPMPLASLVHDNFLSAAARGKGEMDWAALAEVIAENAGLD